VSRLRGKRLGKSERRTLLRAAAAGDVPVVIVPVGPSQAAQTAERRAVSTLRQYGLITVPDYTIRLTPGNDPSGMLSWMERQYVVARFAERTNLGEAVVQCLGAELEAGKRVRWALALDGISKAVASRCPYYPDAADAMSPVLDPGGTSALGRTSAPGPLRAAVLKSLELS
jgi:hypothetical protein